MIQIDRHIEVLLLDNDCVIVPDLGGFMAYHVPARYVKETGQFIPPSRQLGFNAQLKINDSLLVQSYIEAYDISYPEALRRIEVEVEEMRQMIQNTGVCELNDIGVLRINEHGSMEFEPCEAGILTPGLYGLNTLDILPLSHSVEVDRKPVIDVAASGDGKPRQEDKKDDIAVTPIVPAPIDIVAKEDEGVVDEEDDEENGGSTSRFEVVKRVVAIAAVVLALFIIAFPFGSPSQQLSRSYLDSGFLYNLFAAEPSSSVVTPKPVNVKKASAKPMVKPVVTARPAAKVAEQVKPVAKAVETEKTVTKAVEVKPVDARKTDAKPDDQTKVEKSGPYYAIVLASCVPHKNADSMVKQLGKAGLADATVVDRQNGSKVVYGHFSSETEARQSLRSLRTKDGCFEKGWVMKFN